MTIWEGDNALLALPHGRIQQGRKHGRTRCEDDAVRLELLILNLERHVRSRPALQQFRQLCSQGGIWNLLSP